jgi:hypothetical protein
MKTRCAARQYSDQMHCQVCRLTWDMNDPDPPACRRAEPDLVQTGASGKDLLRPLDRPLEFASGQPLPISAPKRLGEGASINAPRRHIC